MATEWKCLECGKTFGVGDWTCSDGISNHRVEEKLYRSLDAPADPGHGPGGIPLETSSYGQTRVCNIPPPKKVMQGDQIAWVGEGHVDFVRGRYATNDPEKQYWLDKKPAYNATEEQWQIAWLSKSQQLENERQKLNAERMRLEVERNEMLAAVKERTKSAVTANR